MIAIFSDIHANAPALEAVLKDMQTLEVSTALCLGDTVGYGPDAAECVKLVRDQCVASIMGNHEAMLIVLEKMGPQEFGETVSAPLELAQKQLSNEEMEWVVGLPIGIDLDAFEVIHGSLHEPPEFHYIESPETAADHFQHQNRPVSFHGHTHVAAVWERTESGRIHCYAPEEKIVRLDPERQYAINVGSVGQPRDGNVQASYAIYDHAEGLLLHRRVPYDISAVQKRFRKAGLPAFNSQRLAKGK
jgi:diadenosine tetraphosphatase ApaH/serine/threonine PP2A family protein phosphatase